VAALAAAGASAATFNSVSISGPRTATAGQQVKLHFTGYATPNARRLRVWLDDHRCAISAKAEGARPEVEPPSKYKLPSGDFKAELTVKHSTVGTHVVCAYLIYPSSQNTAARASWRYVTH
jgi:hypothetical protein